MPGADPANPRQTLPGQNADPTVEPPEHLPGPVAPNLLLIALRDPLKVATVARLIAKTPDGLLAQGVIDLADHGPAESKIGALAALHHAHHLLRSAQEPPSNTSALSPTLDAQAAMARQAAEQFILTRDNCTLPGTVIHAAIILAAVNDEAFRSDKRFRVALEAARLELIGTIPQDALHAEELLELFAANRVPFNTNELESVAKFLTADKQVHASFDTTRAVVCAWIENLGLGRELNLFDAVLEKAGDPEWCPSSGAVSKFVSVIAAHRSSFEEIDRARVGIQQSCDETPVTHHSLAIATILLGSFGDSLHSEAKVVNALLAKVGRQLIEPDSMGGTAMVRRFVEVLPALAVDSDTIHGLCESAKRICQETLNPLTDHRWVHAIHLVTEMAPSHPLHELFREPLHGIVGALYSPTLDKSVASIANKRRMWLTERQGKVFTSPEGVVASATRIVNFQSHASTDKDFNQAVKGLVSLLNLVAPAQLALTEYADLVPVLSQAVASMLGRSPQDNDGTSWTNSAPHFATIGRALINLKPTGLQCLPLVAGLLRSIQSLQSDPLAEERCYSGFDLIEDLASILQDPQPLLRELATLQATVSQLAQGDTTNTYSRIELEISDVIRRFGS